MRPLVASRHILLVMVTRNSWVGAVYLCYTDIYLSPNFGKPLNSGICTCADAQLFHSFHLRGG